MKSIDFWQSLPYSVFMSHGCRNLVISCIDYRFRRKVADWIRDELQDDADLVAVAGASKGLLDDLSRPYILNLIRIAVQLHDIHHVYILDHVDCGAYGGSKEHSSLEREETFHTEKCLNAQDVIAQEFPDLHVTSYVLEFEGIHKCP